MFSTRNVVFNIAVALAVTSSVALTGCQRTVEVPTADLLSAEPILVDGAMQQRNWSQSKAEYQSFSTEARPTGFTWTQKYDDNGHYTGPGGEKYEGTVLLTDVPIFLANLIVAPVALIVSPPWTPTSSSGGSVPHTHTAAYPLTPIR